MAGGKESPRQKMIGMMYLVLTALLALNVAKDILQAFVVLNNGIETSNTSFDKKIGEQYDILKGAFAKNENKVRKYYEQGQIVRKETDLIMDYLNEVKAKLIAYDIKGEEGKVSDYKAKGPRGKDTVVDMVHLESLDNYDKPANVLGLTEPEKPKPGKYSSVELEQKLTDYKKKLQSIVADNPSLVKNLNELFELKGGRDGDHDFPTWSGKTLYHRPLAAVVTILSKVQSDIKTAEAEVLTHVMSNIDKLDVKFNKTYAGFYIKTPFVAVGDSITGNVFLGGLDTTKDADFFLEGKKLDVKGGTGYFREIATTAGEFKKKAKVVFEGPDGKPREEIVEISYKVTANDEAVIDAEALNVLYQGLENPINISVPGVDSDNLEVSCSSPKVKIKGSSGKYKLEVADGFVRKEQVEIVVRGKTATGGSKVFGSKKFKLLYVPAPKPFIDGIGGDKNTMALEKAQSLRELTARLEDFIYDGVEYKIAGFTFSLEGAGGKSNDTQITGGRITDAVKAQLAVLRKGQIITFKDIRAIGPGGKVKNLIGMTFKLN